MELLFRIFVIVFYDILILSRKHTLLLHVPYSSISLCHHLLDIFQDTLREFSAIQLPR